MAKKKQKTNAIRILEQKKIEYEENEFEWSEEHIDAITAAHNSGVSEDEIYKTLVAVGNKSGPIVAVIPGNEELDLKALAKVSGNKRVEMLHLKDLEETTGYIRGGCSPIGMKKLFPTYIDSKGKEKEYVRISAGRRGLQIKVAALDLAAVVNGKFESICKQ